MEKEIWKDITGYEGYYQVSNKGRIRSVDRTVIGRGGMKMFRKSLIKGIYTDKLGYYHVGLSKEGVLKRHLVHRLIALHFIPNPDNKRCINHIDHNPSNNELSNLEWCTHSENTIHSWDNNKNRTRIYAWPNRKVKSKS